MNRLAVFLIFFSLLTLSGKIKAQEDSLALVQLLRGDYKTLENSDWETHQNNCAPDYLLIENGEVWDLAKEVESMKSKAGIKTTRTDQFDFKSLKVEGNQAYAVYELKSQITRDNQTNNYHWIESAIFQKISGEWKIKLIHSSLIKKW